MDPEANIIQTLQNRVAQLRNQLANTPNMEQLVGQLQKQIAAANAAYQQIAVANNNVGNNNNLKAAKPETFSETNVRSCLQAPPNELQKIKFARKLFNWRRVTMVGTCYNK